MHPSANNYIKPRYLNPEEFKATVAEGYQVTVTGDPGKLYLLSFSQVGFLFELASSG
ncbi:hypothetical protein [Laspinema olomoucense]|uniref:hypothetical protein n=1 Tax=Laspinema olomoucense TaxID=3231600 RepID=UPI0021BA88E1|nr:hypothetical protein [Laspinema sp. D3d]MCT7975874.1 hypothetical protein [Laspinema sp. D3d]